MILKLDRVALEDVGAEPQRVAEAIIKQIDYRSGRVPVRTIARALGITEIREERLSNFEGALVTTSERAFGSILVNANSSRQRRNYTVGHELGHFLNPYHTDAGEGGFSCSTEDLTILSLRPADRRRRAEVEANRFAIELLAPRPRCRALMGPQPDLGNVLAMGREFDISLEAAARRYIELNGVAVAVVFTKERRLRYPLRSQACPALSVAKGDLLRLPDRPTNPRQPTRMEETDVAFWFDRQRGEAMLQTVFQAKGYAISLLWFVPENDEDEDAIEDSFDRFARLNDRD